MISKIKLITYDWVAEVESDHNDKLTIVPEYLEWALGMSVNDFKDELEKRKTLISWEENFYE